jgi:ribonuclease P protein component
MRLNNPQDFKRCFQSGQRIKNKAFVLHYVNNGGLPGKTWCKYSKKQNKEKLLKK